MKMTKQHQLYLGILGLAALGLLADRTFLRPSEAGADSTDEYLVGPDDADDVGASFVLNAAPSIAKRLNALSEAQQINPLTVHDVFTPGWVKPAEPPSAPVIEATAANNAFAQMHKVTAVMGGGTTGYAIVDDKCIRIGQKVGTHKLVAIGNRSATFEADGKRVELTVEVKGRPESSIARPSAAPTQSTPDNDSTSNQKGQE